MVKVVGEFDRTKGLGASEVPAMLGLMPFKGANVARLWLKKVGRMDPEPETPAMKAGHILEPFIAEECRGALPGDMLEVDAWKPHPDHPFLRASIDRILELPGGERANVQIKTSSVPWKWGSENYTDTVQPYVRAQVQTEMAVSGCRISYVPVLMLSREQRDDVLGCWGGRVDGELDIAGIHEIMAGCDLRIFRVYRDELLIQLVIENAVRFWGHVERQEPPDDPFVSDAVREAFGWKVKETT